MCTPEYHALLKIDPVLWETGAKTAGIQEGLEGTRLVLGVCDLCGGNVSKPSMEPVVVVSSWETVSGADDELAGIVGEGVLLARRLARCSLRPASYEKRLARTVAAKGYASPAQRYWLEVWGHHYRRQLRGCPVKDCPACAGRSWPPAPENKRGVVFREKIRIHPARARKVEREQRLLEEHNAAFAEAGA